VSTNQIIHQAFWANEPGSADVLARSNSRQSHRLVGVRRSRDAICIFRFQICISSWWRSCCNPDCKGVLIWLALSGRVTATDWSEGVALGWFWQRPSACSTGVPVPRRRAKLLKPKGLDQPQPRATPSDQRRPNAPRPERANPFPTIAPTFVAADIKSSNQIPPSCLPASTPHPVGVPPSGGSSLLLTQPRHPSAAGNQAAPFLQPRAGTTPTASQFSPWKNDSPMSPALHPGRAGAAANPQPTF